MFFVLFCCFFFLFFFWGGGGGGGGAAEIFFVTAVSTNPILVQKHHDSMLPARLLCICKARKAKSSSLNDTEI